MRLALLSLLCLGLAAGFGGTAPFARVALALGAPGLASLLAPDPLWRGIAEARRGAWDSSAAAFVQVGDAASFNTGVALTQAGHYAAALEAFDMALYLNPADAEARGNFDLLASLYGSTKIEANAIVKWFEERDGAKAAAPLGQGNARAAGTGDQVTNTGALIGLPELDGQGRRPVRKIFDDKQVQASQRWLQSLEDVPGAYLAARIAAERKRRAAQGLAPPEPEDPS